MKRNPERGGGDLRTTAEVRRIWRLLMEKAAREK